MSALLHTGAVQIRQVVNLTIIRMADASEACRITGFLAEHWREDHVFVKRPEILLWQHSMLDLKSLNFVIAEVDGGLVGLLGFIPFRKFDDTLSENTVSLAIWKVANHAPLGSGVRMLNHLVNVSKPTTILAIGLSDMVVPLYESLGYDTGIMNQFVLFRHDLQDSIITGQKPPSPSQLGSSLRKLTESLHFDAVMESKVERMLRKNDPEKSLAYYRNRFESHPWFRYEFLLLGRGESPEILIVTRKVEVEDAVVIRVVDVGGDAALLPNAATAFSNQLTVTGAEYVDILVHGIEDEAMTQNGFLSRNVDSSLIIPNYFDPFERRNVNVAFAFKSDLDNVPRMHFHPADSDQDRPNS